MSNLASTFRERQKNTSKLTLWGIAIRRLYCRIIGRYALILKDSDQNDNITIVHFKHRWQKKSCDSIVMKRERGALDSNGQPFPHFRVMLDGLTEIHHFYGINTYFVYKDGEPELLLPKGEFV